MLYYSFYRRDDTPDRIVEMIQLNATENDPSYTITDVCPAGVYFFTVAAVNEFGARGNFDDGDRAEIAEALCQPDRTNRPSK